MVFKDIQDMKDEDLLDLSYNQKPKDDYSYLMNTTKPESSFDLGGGMYNMQLEQNLPQMKAQAAKVAGLAGSAAATPFMATPTGAAVLIGSQIAMQMAQQKAQAEQLKRQRDMEIAQQRSAGEERGFQTIMEGLRSALR